jgi:hypothetical protein
MKKRRVFEDKEGKTRLKRIQQKKKLVQSPYGSAPILLRYHVHAHHVFPELFLQVHLQVCVIV